jgi:tripartite-type tricarboxylate transporter receptor subunit TctC
MKAKLSDQGVDAQTSTPQEMAQLIVADLAKWEKVVKITGAKAN